MCYIIYKTTNLVNEKIYVGQHCSSADNYLGSGKILQRSIKKYGKNNFIREVLEYCTSGNVNDKEIFWIDKLSATDKTIGYNIRAGGQRPTNTKSHNENISKGKMGYKMTPEHKKNVSKTFFKKGQVSWNKGKNQSEETKEKLRKINLGKKMSKESIDKIRKSHAGKKPYIQNNKTKRNIAKGGTKHIYDIISPSGIKYTNIIILKEFCKKHNLHQRSIWSAFCYHKKDEIKYKNWIIKRRMK